MTQPKTYTSCRACGVDFDKPVKRAVFCSLRCAVSDGTPKDGDPRTCWNWQKGVKANGYGVLSYNGQFFHAHKAALEVKLGRPLADGMETRHDCDNRSCVNPAHLQEGTRSDNMRDCVRRGRHNGVPPLNRGSAHGGAVLDEEKVRDIRRSRIDAPAMGIKYGVSAKTIQKIRRRDSWRHVT